MTVQDTRDVVTTPVIPAPRAAETATMTEPDTTSPSATAPAGGEFPWPEPWHYSRGARPRSEFWDVATASWRSRGPVVAPRPGD
jgi:hypothetical protein